MLGPQCRDFRGELLLALEGRPRPSELTVLSWREHLLSCNDCRQLLEREEALEVLLATLPDPRFTPDQTKRLRARLSGQREAEETDLDLAHLDALLDLDGTTLPVGLADRVRAGLVAERGLDKLLDLWTEPKAPEGLAQTIIHGARLRSEAELESLLDRDLVEVPPHLSQETLRALRAHRDLVVPRLRALRRMPRYAAAAALLLGLLSAPWWTEDGPDSAEHRTEEVASALEGAAAEEVDLALLQSWDVLQNDSLWGETEEGSPVVIEETDRYLQIEESLDLEDELLLAYLPLESAEEDAEGRKPSDG